MALFEGFAQLTGLDFTKRNAQQKIRTTGDGSLFMAPWYQSLVFAGQVYHFHAGSVATGIAGHAAVDADQPEIALRVLGATEVMPLFLQGQIDSGETTLGVHELYFAASNIDIGAGTSTLFTGPTGSADGRCNNMRIDLGGSASQGRHTYSGNGTDPLTAGNFINLGRSGGLIDSNAAVGMIHLPNLTVSAMNRVMPVVRDVGSIVGYGGGGTSTVYFFEVVFFEGSHGDLTS